MGKESSLPKVFLLLNANDDHLVVKVFAQCDLEVSTSIGFVLSFQVVLEHFLQKMYIMITDIVEEKRIDLAHPIQNLDSSKEVAIISMFSNYIHYLIREPLKVLLIMNEERQLQEGVLMDRELNASIRRKLITTPLDANDNIIKTEKLTCIMEMVLRLEELDNTDNLEDRRLSNVLLRYHVTGSVQPLNQLHPSIRDVKMGSSLPYP